MKRFELEWWLCVFQEATYYCSHKYFDKDKMESDYSRLNWIRERIIKKYGNNNE